MESYLFFCANCGFPAKKIPVLGNKRIGGFFNKNVKILLSMPYS